MLARTAPSSAFYHCDSAHPQRLQRALADLAKGFARWRLALSLARLDIRNRYRGSVLGPFWLTLSTAIMVCGIGLLYSQLFQMPLSAYLPFLTVSLLIWNMIAQTVSDACTSLVSAEAIIRQMPLPYTVHVLRFLLRNALIAAHNLPLILIVFLLFGVLPGWTALMALVGLGLIAVNAFAIGMFLGMICARFRDVQQIVASVMQLAFFLSPVLWKPELLNELQVLLPLNPFYVLMQTVRGPLLENGAPPLIWACAVLYTILTSAIAFGFFARFRARIAFWV
ncbi:ABC transporter permease [Elioraea tepida]|uniref:Transport permease protein n=1 Tax=Elioraea tepida TaxID=2843330 RepID=A0A975YJP9_9PROT|nr:ABC transporter permease [Elioraea tepida]QXM25015.1 ABC transporter permease [Elioraea tepida]